MGKRGQRQTEFVCCAVIENKCVSKSIEANSSEEAIKKFVAEFSCEPNNIHGPHYPTRSGILDNTRDIEFSNEKKVAIYKDWIVFASILKVPKNSAYLLFDKRVDGKKVPKPIGTFIIKLEELKDYNNEKERVG